MAFASLQPEPPMASQSARPLGRAPKAKYMTSVDSPYSHTVEIRRNTLSILISGQSKILGLHLNSGEHAGHQSRAPQARNTTRVLLRGVAAFTVRMRQGRKPEKPHMPAATIESQRCQRSGIRSGTGTGQVPHFENSTSERILGRRSATRSVGPAPARRSGRKHKSGRLCSQFTAVRPWLDCCVSPGHSLRCQIGSRAARTFSPRR